MFSDAPPSRDEVTTSRVWRDSTDVKTFTNSGMIAPASVPQVMMAPSFHQSVPSPSVGISRYDATNVIATEMIDVSHTARVSGASKFIFATSWYCALEIATLMKYDRPDAITMK